MNDDGGILGPDGKPYRKPETPKTPKVTYGFDAGRVGGSGGSVIPASLWARLFQSDSPFVYRPDKPVRPNLADTVAAQVQALTASFDGVGHPEMPTPPRDLSTYRDAYADARAHCDHRDAVETLYQREWVCDDCHRVLSRDDLRRARGF